MTKWEKRSFGCTITHDFESARIGGPASLFFFFGIIGPLSYDLGSLYITHVGLSGLAMNPVFSMRFGPCRKSHEVNLNREAIGVDVSITTVLIIVILLSC